MINKTSIPTSEELASLLAALYFGQYSTNEDKRSLDREIVAALKGYNIATGQFENSSPQPGTVQEALRDLLDGIHAGRFVPVNKGSSGYCQSLVDAGELALSTAPAAPTEPTTKQVIFEVGRRMVEITTTLRGIEEWPMIPELWMDCLRERDAAVAQLAQQAAPKADIDKENDHV